MVACVAACVAAMRRTAVATATQRAAEVATRLTAAAAVATLEAAMAACKASTATAEVSWAVMMKTAAVWSPHHHGAPPCSVGRP